MQRMMRNRQIVALLVAVALFLTACGPSASAAAMSLAKAEGTVGIADGGGKSIPVSEDRSLYSGYRVGTEAKSHAWISLDDVKLVKMDEESAIELRKKWKMKSWERQSHMKWSTNPTPCSTLRGMSCTRETSRCGPPAGCISS